MADKTAIIVVKSGDLPEEYFYRLVQEIAGSLMRPYRVDPGIEGAYISHVYFGDQFEVLDNGR